jgi:lipid II:glycine glycyltransferase (peptidoglycan interpeptide bridge formation enzyme)
MPQLSASAWASFLARHPQAHLLQSESWGNFKGEFGWDPVRIGNDRVGVQLLFRRIPLGFSIAYIPRGPVGGTLDELLPEIDSLCKVRRAIFLKLEPDGWESVELAQPAPTGFMLSDVSIQPARTITIDLDEDEDQILARMKQKTRYNVRLAGRKGVEIRLSDDVQAFHELMVETGGRDGFGIHSQDYYARALDLFGARDQCALLAAFLDDELLAAVMVFAVGNRAWYIYGASSDRKRNTMPAYLLQWEAMRWAKGRGCVEYDLWGVPDADAQALEDQFTERADGLWGVYRFKRGFGGQLRRSPGPWDRVYNPLLYRLYQLWSGRS